MLSTEGTNNKLMASQPVWCFWGLACSSCFSWECDAQEAQREKEVEEVEECGVCLDAKVEVEIDMCHHKLCCECAKAICCLEVHFHSWHSVLSQAYGNGSQSEKPSYTQSFQGCREVED